MHKNKKENDFYFDSGDYTDLKSVIVENDKGQAAMRLLSACKLDGSTIGNNEVDLNYESVAKLVECGYSFVVANVTDNYDKHIPGLSTSKIYEKAGKRFLVLGIAPFYNQYMEDGKYDYCILLSHAD